MIRGSQERWLRWTCYTIAILVFCVNGMVTIVFYANCIPAEKTWNPSIQGTCWNPESFGDFLILQGSFSAATDYILCILPIFLFKDLQVGMKNKIILCTLMGLGLMQAYSHSPGSYHDSNVGTAPVYLQASAPSKPSPVSGGRCKTPPITPSWA